MRKINCVTSWSNVRMHVIYVWMTYDVQAFLLSSQIDHTQKLLNLCNLKIISISISIINAKVENMQKWNKSVGPKIFLGLFC